MKWKRGFTLTEVAIVLVILGLLISSVVGGIGTQRETQKAIDTNAKLKDIKQSLLTFAGVNGFLPCPDSDGDGLENRNGTRCSADRGGLPFLDIGIVREDGWGNDYRYAVNQGVDAAGTWCSVAQTEPTCYFDRSALPNPRVLLSSEPVGGAASAGNLTVSDIAGTPIATELTAVIISFAGNGKQTLANCNNADVSPVERENCDNDADFTKDSVREVAGGEFDDLVTWIEPLEIKSMLISLGKLPQ